MPAAVPPSEPDAAGSPAPVAAIDLYLPGGTPPRRVEVHGPLEVGRDGVDLVVADPAVSRRHVRLEPNPAGTALLVTDLGSRHGTYVDGVRIAGPTVVAPGSKVVVGDTVLAVLPPAPAVAGGSRDGEVVVLSRPGSEAARCALRYEGRARDAWRKLRTVLPDGAVLVPVVHLTDPFPDAEGRVVTSGSVVDTERGEVWTVATADTPPDDPGRTLALLVAARLPDGDELGFLVEGYGLHVAGVASTDNAVRAGGYVPASMAQGDARAAAAVSFVRFLLERESEASLCTLLRTTPRGGLDAALTATFGRGLAALEQAWANRLGATAKGDVKASQFLRLAVRYVRPYKWRQVELLVYTVLTMSFSMALPFVSRRLFDSALPSGEFSEVLQLLFVLAVAFTLSLLAGVRQAWLSAYVSGCVVRDLREQMFGRLQALPLSWFQRYRQGEVISRLFNDVRGVEAGLSQAIGQGLSQALGLVMSTAIMLSVDLLLGFVVLLAVPLIVVVYRKMSAGALKRSIALQEENSGLLSVAAENYGAQPVVKLFGLQGRETGRFSASGERVVRAERRVSLFGAMFGLSVNTIMTGLRLVVLGLGSWLILHDRFTLGGMVAFLGVMGEVLAPVTGLTTLGQSIQRSGGSLLRVNEVLGAELEDDDPARPALAPLAKEIRFEDVDFSYEPGQPAIRSLSCTIPAGSRVAFVGPSGSGKSTVLRLLMRLHEPEAGRITFDGVDLRACRLASLRDQLGVVLQEPFLFDTSLRENIALGRSGASDAEIVDAARAAEVGDFIASLPRGFDTPAGERGGRLSGGQRQRVSIARALVRRPTVLLLDEATSALDPATERQISATLDRLATGRTTVAITHRLTSIVNYDRIFVIEQGQLVEQGTHPELVALGGVYAHLWSEQTGEALAPTAPELDLPAVLAQQWLFRDLPATVVAESAAAFVAEDVPDGHELVEGDGNVWVVAGGRAEVVVARPSGPVVAATLSVGDAFGVGALLGESEGRRLRAVGRVHLLRLAGGALERLAARHPELGARLTRPAADAPVVRGTRVPPMTSVGLAAAPSSGTGTGTASAAGMAAGTGGGVPDDAAVRRATGAFPRIAPGEASSAEPVHEPR